MSRPAPNHIHLFTLVKEAALAFSEDKAPRLAAAIAFYAMLSLSPLLLLATAVLGRYLSDPAIIQNLFGPEGIITQNMGQKAADYLKDLIPKEHSLMRGSAIATAVGLVTLFMGSTGLLVQLQDALNSMWGAEPPPPQTILVQARTRVLSFFMILLIGGILLAFLALNTWLSAIATRLGQQIGFGAVLTRLSALLASSAALTFVFAFIYKFLPSIKLQWRETWIGAAVTAFLFSLGQILISIYLGRTAPGSALGAATALFVLLLWIYLSGMIFFYGAEITWVYSQKYGSHAGGARNPAKKAALAAQGVQIDPAPSEQERQAAQKTRFGARLPQLPRLPRVLPQVATRAEGRLLPTVRGTLLTAFLTLCAVPAVIALRILGLAGGKKSPAAPMSRARRERK